ncbi:MAG TPA: hypothetical protein VK168_06975 [Saprospiraceae bacterium]|nr:hypothetical protein [Saprospiraceae bacterium]
MQEIMTTIDPSKAHPNKHPARRSMLNETDLITLRYHSKLFWLGAFIAIPVLAGIWNIWTTIYTILLDNGLYTLLHFWMIGLVIVLALFLAFCLNRLHRQFLIRKDIKASFKIVKKLPIVHKSIVVKQQNRFKSRRFFVWIGGRKRKFRHEVDHSRYSRLKIGQTITAEFAPHSNICLNMRWYY